MAKKKQAERRFGQLPMPSGHKSYSVNKLNWIGLNKRQTVNSGELSQEENMSTHEYPYMVPCEGRKEVIKSFLGEYTADSTFFRPIGVFAFENVIVVLYGDATFDDENNPNGYHIYIQYVVLDDNGDIALFDDDYKIVFGGVVQSFSNLSAFEEACKKQRSVVLFNQYDNNANILGGKYLRKLIILPDKKTVNFDFADYNKAEADWLAADESRTAPDMDESINCFTNKNTIYYKKTKYKRDDGSDIYKFIYYRWSDTKTEETDSNGNTKYVGGFVALNGTDGVNSDCLICDDLETYDPVIYYNDGYVETEDEYAQIGTDYYERVNYQKPYEYRKVTGLTMASEGESVEGLYELVEKSEDLLRYEETEDTEYKAGKAYFTYDTEDGKYEVFEGSSFVENITYYELVEVTKEESYYILTEDSTAQSDKVYFKKVEGADGSITYNEATISSRELDGSEVGGYYEFTNDLSPGSDAAELDEGTALKADTYYFNTYNSMIYLFVKNESGSETVDGEKGDFKISSICPFPDINYAVVHQSRLFGVGDDRIYVSGFNDYANWNYDTINESYAKNAWTTTAQANTKAGGRFTGISVYDNHVCCFKSDFMHEIYNSQNPFRLVDIGAIGTIDNRSIQEVNGRLIFVTEDGVKMYTGSTPREIGYELGIDRFAKAVAGSDNRYYYLSCEEYNGDKYFFVYDTQIGAWSEQSASDDDYSFLAVGIAKAEHGMYMLTDRGKLYRMDTGVYSNVYNDDEENEVSEPIKWSFETDLSTGTTSSFGYRSVNIKHIRKIQFLAEMPEGDAEFKVYILCDDEELDPDTNKWQLAYTSKGKTGMLPVRIKPRKTAHYGYRLRFEGSGYVKIHEIEVYVRQGGELYESD